MPTTKDAVKNAKLDLSWVERDPNYIAWRNQVKDYCSTRVVVPTRLGLLRRSSSLGCVN